MSHTPTPWFFNESIDLDEWLPALSTSPLEGQDNPAYGDYSSGLVACFHPQYKPSDADRKFLLRAVNSHEALLAACQSLMSALVSGQDRDAALQAGREALSAARKDYDTPPQERFLRVDP